jgi:2-dehydro-3-deoxy-D-gluconate 5-dehydrogenase
MNTELRDAGNSEYNKSVNGRIPADRWGRAEDFKGPVVFLASRASDWVHGETLVVRPLHQ